MRPSSLVILALLALPVTPVYSTLIDYYTLNDATLAIGGGRADSSGSSLGGGDLINQSGSGSTSLINGKVGGALSFPNSLNYNSGPIANIAFPFSLSIWVNTTEPGNVTDKAIGIEDQAAGDRDFSLAVVNAGRVGGQVGRNGALDLTVGTTNIADGTWHLLTGVFSSATSRTLYIDGKFTGTRTVSEALWANNTTTRVNVGGFLRSTGLVDQFNGALDDAGYFDTDLFAADAALIFGLAQTGAIGLDQLDEAQSLNNMQTGSTALVGGLPWQKASGLTGTTGDFGGTVAGDNAFIVTDASGNGLQLVPEPTAVGLLMIGLGALGATRRRRGV
jgi:hypothetical protein